LAAENISLRHQLAVLHRSQKAAFTPWDRALWAFGLRRWNDWSEALILVKPETVIRWHRKAYRIFWTWKSRGGRPRAKIQIRTLVRRMATENPTWGAPRIHGELLMLGYRVGERTVSRYLERIRPAPMKRRTQSWRTFLRDQAKGIVCVDLFTVQTVRFQTLYIFVILHLETRKIVAASATQHPNSRWLGQQIINAYPWNTAPRFLIRDREKVFGKEFSRRVAGMDIEEILTAIRSPKMNAHCERVIGTLRRECFDHIIVWNERHAQRLIRDAVVYYNEDRTHLALGKNTPSGRAVESTQGNVIALPRVGGLHHRYTRQAA
jgi:transposase InsO family protein